MGAKPPSRVQIPPSPPNDSRVVRLAPVAQLDRASDYGSEGQGFESSRAHQTKHDGHGASHEALFAVGVVGSWLVAIRSIVECPGQSPSVVSRSRFWACTDGGSRSRMVKLDGGAVVRGHIRYSQGTRPAFQRCKRSPLAGNVRGCGRCGLYLGCSPVPSFARLP